MNNLENYTDSFKTRLDLFIHECDFLENEGLWDYEAFGEMEGYFSNDFTGIILSLIAVDGNISDRETDYVNKAFGFEYSTDELSALYKNCIENVEESFEDNFKNGLLRIESIDRNVAKLYKELVTMLCEIIINSDGAVTPPEAEAAMEILKLCK